MVAYLKKWYSAQGIGPLINSIAAKSHLHAEIQKMKKKCEEHFSHFIFCIEVCIMQIFFVLWRMIFFCANLDRDKAVKVRLKGDSIFFLPFTRMKK